MGTWHWNRLCTSPDRAVSHYRAGCCVVCGAGPLMGALRWQPHVGSARSFSTRSIYSSCRRVCEPALALWTVMGIDRPNPNPLGYYRYWKRHPRHEKYFIDLLHQHGGLDWLALATRLP